MSRLQYSALIDRGVAVIPLILCQALDKLVGNAIDFHAAGTAIRITVTCLNRENVQIQVDNQGPPLPSDMEQALFQSMVSVRTQTGEEPHLGLGLYLVGLIMEFHQGGSFAENLPGGVRFCMELPIEST